MDFRARFRPRFDGAQQVFVFTASFALVHTLKMRNSLVLDDVAKDCSRWRLPTFFSLDHATLLAK